MSLGWLPFLWSNMAQLIILILWMRLWVLRGFKPSPGSHSHLAQSAVTPGLCGSKVQALRSLTTYGWNWDPIWYSSEKPDCVLPCCGFHSSSYVCVCFPSVPAPQLTLEAGIPWAGMSALPLELCDLKLLTSPLILVCMRYHLWHGHSPHISGLCEE